MGNAKCRDGRVGTAETLGSSYEFVRKNDRRINIGSHLLKNLFKILLIIERVPEVRISLIKHVVFTKFYLINKINSKESKNYVIG